MSFSQESKDLLRWGDKEGIERVDKDYITQDSIGRIVCASNAGLLFYDGVEWRNFSTKTDVNFIHDDAVQHIELINDEYWIGLDGAGMIRVGKDTIINYLPSQSDGSGLFSGHHFDFFQISKDKVLLATNRGVSLVDLSTNSSSSFIMEGTDNVRNKWSYNFIEVDDTVYLSSFYGLYELDVENKICQLISDKFILYHIIEHQDKIIAATYKNGIQVFDLKSNRWIDVEQWLVQVNDLERINDTLLVAATEENGIVYFNAIQKSYEKNVLSEFGIDKNSRCKDVYYDKTTGYIWAGFYEEILAYPFQSNLNLDPHLYIKSIKSQTTQFRRHFQTFSHIDTLLSDERELQVEWEVVDPYANLNQEYSYRVNQGAWRTVDANNRTLTGLKGGTNSIDLRIRDIQSSRVWSKTIQVEVNKFLWEKLWFRILAFLLSLLILLLFIGLYKRNQKRIKDLRQQHSKDLLRSQMDALSLQMNPHFLFNTMNSINDFILQSNNREASRYLTKFAHLMRMILNMSKNSLNDLRDEIEFLKLYTLLENVRFNNRFEILFNIDEEVNLDDWQIPPMLIQPFVENAILHGLRPLEERQGRIVISFSIIDDVLIVEIEDNGIGREKSKLLKQNKVIKKKSHGLEISKDRVALLNSTGILNISLAIIDKIDKSAKARGTLVQIKIL